MQFIDPDEKSRGTIQGYLRLVSRPGGDVMFDWRLSRRHGELTTLLTDDYVGLLQSDGYEAVRREVAQVDVQYAWSTINLNLRLHPQSPIGTGETGNGLVGSCRDKRASMDVVQIAVRWDAGLQASMRFKALVR